MLFAIHKPRRAPTLDEQIEVIDGKVTRATVAVAHLIGEEFGYVSALITRMGRRLTPAVKEANLVSTFKRDE